MGTLHIGIEDFSQVTWLRLVVWVRHIFKNYLEIMNLF
jgi:hypothetical protein